MLNAKSGPRIRQVPSENKPYETITVDKLTPVIGAEIGGIDLSRPLSGLCEAEVRRALAENLVIFFRDQALSPADQLAFGRLFGDLHLHPAAPHERGVPELMIIHTDRNSPRANGEGWHSDVSCDPEPPMGSILYIRECPPNGGDTLFANMYAAYEALSDRLKAYLDGLTAVHDGEHVYRGLFAATGEPDRASYPRAEHPVVRTPPRDWTTGALRQSWIHNPHPGHPHRRERRDSPLPVRAHGESPLSMPLSLAAEFGRFLGQPLHPASSDVGLLATHAHRPSRHGQGYKASVAAPAVTGAAGRG